LPHSHNLGTTLKQPSESSATPPTTTTLSFIATSLHMKPAISISLLSTHPSCAAHRCDSGGRRPPFLFSLAPARSSQEESAHATAPLLTPDGHS